MPSALSTSVMLLAIPCNAHRPALPFALSHLLYTFLPSPRLPPCLGPAPLLCIPHCPGSFPSLCSPCRALCPLPRPPCNSLLGYSPCSADSFRANRFVLPPLCPTFALPWPLFCPCHATHLDSYLPSVLTCTQFCRFLPLLPSILCPVSNIPTSQPSVPYSSSFLAPPSASPYPAIAHACSPSSPSPYSDPYPALCPVLC